MVQEVEAGCRYVIEDPFCESALDCLERCLKKRIQVKKKMCQCYKCKKKKKLIYFYYVYLM
ncbi:hypothetical protein HanXRQr2_Chr12g0540581 [Helianthus annuus]|uniref:Uncharacterized protein n=1 Tax=Helianthus annuus TaxID=4232 RepID=A0A9K3HGC9_HELAN|nr:hypothetical protein HanXRQr2_Chr12g0540581 [Helianthus annuus]KAJ0862617.1 hypothetical protein HanPSC8_Chr12g0520321 [Helianthus annuus]